MTQAAQKGSLHMQRQEFQHFVSGWATRIGVEPRRVQVQSMTRKWASCSTRGTLSFADDLLCQDGAFLEYVVVHELLHLIAPNHGKLFRSLMRTYLPRFADTAPATSCGFARERPRTAR